MVDNLITRVSWKDAILEVIRKQEITNLSLQEIYTAMENMVCLRTIIDSLGVRVCNPDINAGYAAV